jgi:hypothetical protein
MHNLVKGKIAEAAAVAKLLENGFEVFSSIADIQGTDLVVAPPNTPQRLLRIQVKSISSSDKAFRIQPDHKTVDYYFLINTENGDMWIIPNSEIVRKLQQIKRHPKIKDLMLPVFRDEWVEYSGFNHILKQLDNTSFKFHSGRTGKIGEKMAVAYFLRNDFDVYESVADRKGVDLLVSKDDNFLKVQVKYSSNGYSFRNIRTDFTSDKYYFLFINGARKEFFFVSLVDVKKIIGKSASLTINKKLRELWLKQNPK